MIYNSIVSALFVSCFKIDDFRIISIVLCRLKWFSSTSTVKAQLKDKAVAAEKRNEILLVRIHDLKLTDEAMLLRRRKYIAHQQKVLA